MRSRDDLPLVLRFFVKKKRHESLESEARPKEYEFKGEAPKADAAKPSFLRLLRLRKPAREPEEQAANESTQIQTPDQVDSVVTPQSDSDRLVDELNQKPKRKIGFSLSWKKRKAVADTDSVDELSQHLVELAGEDETKPRGFKLGRWKKQPVSEAPIEEEVVRAIKVAEHIETGLGKTIALQAVLVLIVASVLLATHIFFIVPNEARLADEKQQASDLASSIDLKNLQLLKLIKTRKDQQSALTELVQRRARDSQRLTTRDFLDRLVKNSSLQLNEVFTLNRDRDLARNPMVIYGREVLVYRTRVALLGDYFGYLKFREALHNSDRGFEVISESATVDTSDPGKQVFLLEIRIVDL